jgi:hypothetical protein
MSSSSSAAGSSLQVALPMFFHQPVELGPSKNMYRNLCAFYAIRHFLGDRGAQGYLSINDFFIQAVKKYTTELGMSKEEAEGLAKTGNDPTMPDLFLPNASETPPAKIATRTKIMIAFINRGHFITVLKVGLNWYDYDSLLPKAALISSINTFLKINPGDRYWSC